jgi:hypothetical protein
MTAEEAMSERESHDDVHGLDPAKYTRRVLLAAAAGQRPDLHPTIAVALLARKRYSAQEKASDLAALLDGEGTPPRARTSAAIELGRLGTDDAEAVLTSRSKQRGPVRAPAEAGLRELLRLGRPTPAAGGAPRRGSQLARVLGAAEQASAESPLYVDEERARPITTRKASARQLAGVTEGLADDIDQLGLDAGSGREVRCFDQRLVVLTPAELVVALESARPGAPQIAAAIATHDTQETGEWSARYYVVVMPGEGGDMELRVMTRQGRTAFAGQARLVDGAIEFSVRAVSGPGNAPALAEGRLGPDGLRFTRAMSEPTVSARRTVRPRR